MCCPGGRAYFKWQDVANSQHRENYLGHSLMARMLSALLVGLLYHTYLTFVTAVGRWQKGRDLNWYAKADAAESEMSESEARKAELKRIKEAESDALARAMGYDLPPRPSTTENPNMTALGGEKELRKNVGQSFEDNEDEDEVEKGLGYGGFKGFTGTPGSDVEVMEGNISQSRKGHEGPRSFNNLHDQKRNDRRPSGGYSGRNHRSRSKDRERRAGDRRYRDIDGERGRRSKHYSRSRSRSRERRQHGSRTRRRNKEWNRHEKRNHAERRHHDLSPHRRRPEEISHHRHRGRSRSP